MPALVLAVVALPDALVMLAPPVEVEAVVAVPVDVESSVPPLSVSLVSPCSAELHAAIGREWLISQHPDKKAAIDAGDKAWSKILSNWQQVKDQGLTKHENWWPRIYRQACERWGVQPDPRVLAYDTSDAATRADLKTVTGSA